MLNTLIVEDNAAHRQALHYLLQGRFPSIEIDEASDGRDAMRRALSHHFDLVFMDIRLPQGNGLELTKAIKRISADTFVCIFTSYDILEYRDAAFHNGADHFMVKGDSSEAEIVDLVESLLRTRFVTLILVGDPLRRRQFNTLLSIRWPDMIVAETGDLETGLDHAMALRPNLVLLELALSGSNTDELVRDIRDRSPGTMLVGLTDDIAFARRVMTSHCGVDHYAPLAPMGHTELMGIVNALQAMRTHH